MADMGAWIRSHCSMFNELNLEFTIEPHVVELDTFRGGEGHNRLDLQRQTEIVSGMRDGKWDLVIAAPPCNTWSRALFSDDKDPNPLRGFFWPHGFPHLPKDKSEAMRERTTLVEFSLECLKATTEAKHDASWRSTSSGREFPEDLGSTPRGEPASLWQLEAARELGQTSTLRGAIVRC